MTCLLKYLGWQINYAKSILTPQTCLQYLSIVWNPTKTIPSKSKSNGHKSIQQKVRYTVRGSEFARDSKFCGLYDTQRPPKPQSSSQTLYRATCNESPLPLSDPNLQVDGVGVVVQQPQHVVPNPSSSRDSLSGDGCIRQE